MDPSGTEADPFATPRRAKAVMAGFRRAWYLAGGWALDLYLRRVTRPHEDVEVAVFREDQEALRAHLAGWSLERIARTPEGGKAVPWREGDRIDPLDHEVHARRASGDLRHLEVLLNEREGGTWRYRRDPRVTMPLADLGFPAIGGIPILAPEVVLLYKAKMPRPVDDADFGNAIGALPPPRRAWLQSALRTAHPGSPWIARLTGAAHPRRGDVRRPRGRGVTAAAAHARAPARRR